MKRHLLEGRQLLKKEIPRCDYQKIQNEPNIEIRDALVVNKKTIICQRCGFTSEKSNYKLSSNHYYCPQCIQLKRVDSKEKLISLPTVKQKKRVVDFCFQGVLTKEQAKVSRNLIRAYEENKLHLIHAVTGAGKTEMLFELINQVLSDGGRVGIAAPRVDVCLELFPRLKDVFPNEEIDLLYGKSPTKFTGSPFIICTTHQLLRFYHFFDVLIIDEVDAYPYKNADYLQYGMRNSVKKEAQIIFMTATSENSLEKEVKDHQGSKSLVSRRYHGFDLPVPKMIYIKKLSEKLRQGYIPHLIKKKIEQVGQTTLIFFPNINLMKESYSLFKKEFKTKRIAYVYAGKEDREDIIQKMRQGEWDILLTTTILERGVTFSNICVIVMCADHRVYNKASLIQIAGRVGRDKRYPTGQVLFFHEGKTKAMSHSIKEIKMRNGEK